MSTLDSVAQIAGSIPVIGSMAKVGYGVELLRQSFVERKKQRKLRGYQKEDLAERRQASRLNEYVNTPYSYQAGGFYNNMMEQNQDIQRRWEEYYNDINNQNIQKYKNLQTRGVQSASTGIGEYFNTALQMVSMQEGGGFVTSETPEDGTLDINSENFDPNAFLGTEQAVVQETVSQNDELLKWVFEDVEDYSPVQDEYESYSNNSNISSGTPSSSIIESIGQSESGGNYNVVNDTTGTTGKYQFHPRYWATQIGEFMGVDGTKEEIMNEFKNSPKTQESFMNYVVNDIYKPEIKKLKPYSDKYGFTEEQMIRLLHYRGLTDAKRRLISGDFEVSAEEQEKYRNPQILDYIKK
jgi:hypothetical protein